NAGTDGILRVCERDAPADLFLSLGNNPDPGGSWVDPAGNPISGVIDPATAPDGVYTYTAWAIVPCTDDLSTVTLTVDKMPDPGVNASIAVCPDAPSFDLFPLLGPTALAGGDWTAPDGSPVSNTFDPGESDGGLYTYTLHGPGECADETITATVDVTVYPAPPAIFSFAPEKGCIPLPVLFSLKSTTDIVSAHWFFGDAYTATEIPRTNHVYEQPGDYPPTVTVTDVNGCQTTWTAREPVRVYPPPSAEFHYSPFPLRTLFETEADFMAWQGGLSDYAWTIGTDSANGQSVHFAFPPAVATSYPVCLDVVDSIGCTARTCQEIVIHESFNVSVPNAFTPNGDGDNDVFRPVMLGFDERSLSLEIFDRWGTRIYGSTEATMGWNGSKDNGGEVLPEGVYVWRLIVQNALSAEREDLFGHVTLLK
ncbi:MAG TPA: gliding motility-associated C-terminal domain-containing protein, partial [Flavobacteriales bacterium]|nr:gliding motility-associated C-terminal domain-containing protein [Flavobacteriales bacterium]